MPWAPDDDILAPRTVAKTVYPEVEATPGLAVEHRPSGVGGVVVRAERDGVVVRTRAGLERVFRYGAGSFSVDRTAVTLVRPTAEAAPRRTASGSVPVTGAAPRVAAASRIWVEGVHDAELVEKVWGDDLRVEGVVVERLDGIDHLADEVRRFAPGPGRRLGVLVDHLVPGSKEARLAAAVRHPHVLVTGTPFVDVWQAVRVDGGWPDVPKGRPWKEGVLAALGVDEDASRFWKRLLGSVRTYADLEPALVGAVESLIDFVSGDT